MHCAAIVLTFLSVSARGGWLADVSRTLWPHRSTRPVPLVDVSALLSSSGGAAQAAAVRSLRRAAESHGVLRLSGHGVSIERVLNASRALFELPLDVKAATQTVQAGGGFQRGYIPMGGEAGLSQFLELKEGFAYGHPWAAGTPPPNNLTGPNSWPEQHVQLLGAEWQATLLGFLNDSLALSGAVSRGLSLGMGRDADFLPQLCERGDLISIMRLFHYFPTDDHPEVAPGKPRIGSSPHTDWHVLTVVLQDTTGGLQVHDAYGEWRDVPAKPGELVVIVGDYTALLSDGRFRSPVHRVLLPPPGQERFSFTFFYYPSYEAPLPAAASRLASAAAPRRSSSSSSSSGWRPSWLGGGQRAVEACAANESAEGATPAANGTAADTQYNTLLQADLRAERPFGEWLLDKWRGVVANRAVG